MRVAIGVPSPDWLMADMAYSLIRLHLFMKDNGQGIEIGQKSARTSVPAQSQNDLFQSALDDDCDAILLIDSDMIFPPDTLLRLLGADAHVAGAVYRMRSPPHPMAWARLDQTPGGADAGLVEADYIPSGMMLVRTDVLREMPYPWMEENYGKSTKDLIGHDPWFCRKARQLGFRILADLDLSREIRHIGAIALPYDIGG